MIFLDMPRIAVLGVIRLVTFVTLNWVKWRVCVDGSAFSKRGLGRATATKSGRIGQSSASYGVMFGGEKTGGGIKLDDCHGRGTSRPI